MMSGTRRIGIGIRSDAMNTVEPLSDNRGDRGSNQFGPIWGQYFEKMFVH